MELNEKIEAERPALNLSLSSRKYIVCTAPQVISARLFYVWTFSFATLVLPSPSFHIYTRHKNGTYGDFQYWIFDT